ncbi:hypothetical protein ACFVWZ_25330 [Streptomyces sp. NPDC058200]|uniref:hypothetical protein n=1 Tax=Streptomyces sp. NPDC058200 TaxID=3346378 RepID=UPI0036ECD3EF
MRGLRRSGWCRLADEVGELGGEGGGAQVESGQHLLGEVEFVIGPAGVGEGQDRRAPRPVRTLS